ncbi:nitroreductase/quinone reductase family protein [Streptosporangium sp. NPDC006930]|uniref:nitroreductase/quinone reductase family protein n=1 Tax=unclassified Streptosporangium TaxID=2632669 RepID=UPI003439D652
MTSDYQRPDRLMVHVINPLVRWLGAASTLRVPGRTTGALQRVPVHVVELADARYLVSVRGRTEWVRNLRAAGHCTVSRRGRRDRYRAVEVVGDSREEVLAAYRARWGTGQVRRLLDRFPDPEDHPVFRLAPLDRSPGQAPTVPGSA